MLQRVQDRPRAAGPAATPRRFPPRTAVRFRAVRFADVDLARTPTAESLRVLAGLFALHDLILAGYFTVLSVLVWRAGPGVAQGVCAQRLYLSVAAILIGCLIGRAQTGLSPRVRSGIYRVTTVGVVIAAYLELRLLLPTVRHDSLDPLLLAVDLRVFGIEPALALERFASRPVVEYFSFFYFSYFWVCLAYAVAVVWICPLGPATSEFAIGTTLVYCVGQLGYIAVPGYGPIVALADGFRGPLEGGFWWGCVRRAVDAGSALKDIFPSLHTAVPVWLTIFALRRARDSTRWRWVAGITAVFAAHIVVSTMLLRWHYACDVAAGIALAIAVGCVVPRLARWERAVRSRLGVGGAWSFD